MVHFQIPVPDKLNFFSYQLPAVSPDGQRIALHRGSQPGPTSDRLFVRPLNAATATEIPIPGVSVRFPFWSPDGQQIAFSAGGALQKSGPLRGTARHHLQLHAGMAGRGIAMG